MQINQRHYESVWFDEQRFEVGIIDQTQLPHRFVELSLGDLGQVCEAIVSMQVRGAPLIGIVGAYGVVLALRDEASVQCLEQTTARLLATRPTAVNLRWAMDALKAALKPLAESEYLEAALQLANTLRREDARSCCRIGDEGLPILQAAWRDKQARDPGASSLNILTHCNAGWLATVDWGTALAPIYKAHAAGIPVHVWVDETRPRNQGAQLTAWELGQQGVPHTLISDNTGGHLMQHQMVDLCIVGSDRTTAKGDVCNKIGTYLKALAAQDNNVPFYVALPVSTIDWSISDGLRDIDIEQRAGSEVTQVQGLLANGEIGSVQIAPPLTNAANYGFDVTPARLVSALITDHGVVAATPAGLDALRQRIDALPA